MAIYFMRTSPDHKYKFTEVYGDPAKARVYKLNNGLTVILAENHLEPTNHGSLRCKQVLKTIRQTIPVWRTI
jgi:hypothetical protein